MPTANPETLQERLKHAALRDRDLDLEIAGDWFAVELDKHEKRQPRAGRKEAKSTSRRSTRDSEPRA
jgi:hypothetical protein